MKVSLTAAREIQLILPLIQSSLHSVRHPNHNTLVLSFLSRSMICIQFPEHAASQVERIDVSGFRECYVEGVVRDELMLGTKRMAGISVGSENQLRNLLIIAIRPSLIHILVNLGSGQW